MKKILAGLATLTILGSAATTVIACGTTERRNDHLFDSVRLREQLRHQMILKLKNSDLGFDLNDFWNRQDLNAIIDNFINDEISKLYTQDVVETNLNRRLSLANANTSAQIQFGDNFSDENNAIINEVTKLNHDNSLLTFFTEYTTSLARYKFNALDFDTKYGSLNPTNVDGQSVENISIYFRVDDNNYRRWTALSDLDESQRSENNLFQVTLGNYIPDQGLLSAETGFYLIENSNELNLTALPSEGVIKENISGREALGYRFQTYLRTQVENRNLENILTIQFMKNEMYRFASAPADSQNPSIPEVAARQGVYYNRDSDFVRNVQTWGLNTNNEEDFHTDLKMVWTISLNTAEQIQQANQILQTNQDAANSRNDDFSTYLNNTHSIHGLSDDQKASNVLEILQLLTALDGSAMATDIPTTISRINEINQSDQGNDPIFGIKGFQGFVRNTSETAVEAVLGGNLQVATTAQPKIARVNGSSAIKNLINANDGTYDFTFENTNEQRNTTRDLVVVLPIYLIDLWKQVSEPGVTETAPEPTPNENPNNLVDLVTNQWIELLPQVTGATWEGVSPVASSGWTEVSADSDTFPTENSYRVVNGRTYIYIAQADMATAPSATNLMVGTTAISFEFSDTNPTDTWFWNHNYGINGVASRRGNPMITNGQRVKFDIHLGQDANLANNMERLWAARRTRTKRSDDLAYLTTDKKTELINTLLYIVATREANIAERAKTQVYSLYINEDDIYYQNLYDRIIRYIRANEEEEESD